MTYRPDITTEDGELLFDLIDVGWQVWERLPEGATYPAKGGTVVERREATDDTPLTFVVVHSPRGRIDFLSLTKDEIDPLLAQMRNSSVMRSRARQMDEQAARRKGAADGFELRMTRYSLALKEALG